MYDIEGLIMYMNGEAVVFIEITLTTLVSSVLEMCTEKVEREITYEYGGQVFQ